MTGWQPIETAPKDGTIIDVWLGDADAGERSFYCAPGSCRSANWHWLEGKWRPFAGASVLVTFVQPTHWQPLPAPPSPTETT